MTEQERILPADNRVQFQLVPGEQLEVSFAADGMVTLYLRPRERSLEPAPTPLEDTAPESLPVAAAPAPELEPTQPPAEAATQPDEDRSAPATPEAQERIRLVGRVGRAPAVRTTRTGRLVATFPLGVHPDQETTVWHHVVAFDKRAASVRDRVKAGDAVEVVGYRHRETRPTTDGQAKVEEQIYAAAVRHQKTTDASPTPTSPEPTQT